MTTFQVSLPYPPTVNTYYRRVGARTLISRKGREYRKAVVDLVCVGEHAHDAFWFPDQRLHVQIAVWVPDRRKRDLDNMLKALLDSMQHAGIYQDDEQIDKLTIERMGMRKGGAVVVTIGEREA